MEPCDPIDRKGLAMLADTSTLSTAFRWSPSGSNAKQCFEGNSKAMPDVKNNTTSNIKATDARNGTQNGINGLEGMHYRTFISSGFGA